MPSEARSCANRVLLRVFEQGAYADRAFHSCAQGLGARERAQAMRLSYGAVQRAGTLNAAIEKLSERPGSALDASVRAALQVALYELLFSDAPAQHAIVDDAVELVKRSRSRGHGLTNAVLRKAARQREELLGALSDDSTPQAAAIAHSHPQWLAEMWWRQLGAERARLLMAANNEPAETALRVNTLLADPAQVAAALQGQQGSSLLGIELPEALLLQRPLDLLATPQWQWGEVLAQSRAAMLVSRVLDPRPGERVLDLCAAPGGKTTHIAALMQGQGRIVAIERHPGRARQLSETVTRLQAKIVEVQVADAAALTAEAAGAALPAAARRPAGERFDRVLLDAPCSGLGTLQSRPDLRWRASPQRIGELVGLQCKMLAAAGEAVRPGGTLVYSTCTISDAENEHQIERFLDSHPDFAVEPAVDRAAIPAAECAAIPAAECAAIPAAECAAIPAAESAAIPAAGHATDPTAGRAAVPAGLGGRAPSPFIATLPDRDRTAGFFIAKLRRS